MLGAYENTEGETDTATQDSRGAGTSFARNAREGRVLHRRHHPNLGGEAGALRRRGRTHGESLEHLRRTPDTEGEREDRHRRDTEGVPIEA